MIFIDELFRDRKIVVYFGSTPIARDAIVISAIITEKSASAEMRTGARIMATAIPALQSYNWCQANLNYLRDWLDTCERDAHKNYSADRLEINIIGDWQLR